MEINHAYGCHHRWHCLRLNCTFWICATCSQSSGLAGSNSFERGALIRALFFVRKVDEKFILETVAQRWAIEECFQDCKEIWGAGQQQVRNVWPKIACGNTCTWLYLLVELASWDQPVEKLVDRSDRPWDYPDRRPSHADR